MKLPQILVPFFTVSLAVTAFFTLKAAEPAKPKPLRVLLVAGGCCHDYEKQSQILAEGLSARANVEVEVAFNPDKGTAPTFDVYKGADWYKNYDVIIHDECAAGIKDAAYAENVLAAHKAGIPGINLHCAMHSYRVGDVSKPVTPGSEAAIWFDFIGLQSSGHGPQEPININYVDKESPITKGLENWTTLKEELYNNVQEPKNFPNHHTLATGKQTVTDKKTGEKKDVETVIVWTNHYGDKKTPVFNTTIGHNNDTVSDARYLDLLARGLLWSAGKLGEDGKAVAGYGPVQK